MYKLILKEVRKKEGGIADISLFVNHPLCYVCQAHMKHLVGGFRLGVFKNLCIGFTVQR